MVVTLSYADTLQLMSLCQVGFFFLRHRELKDLEIKGNTCADFLHSFGTGRAGISEGSS